MSEAVTLPSTDPLRAFLAALVRAALMSDENGRSSLREAEALRDAFLRAPEGLHPASLEASWTLAIRDAEGPSPRDAERRVSTSLPTSCPLSREDIAGPGFDAGRAAAAIRASAATG